MSGHVMSWRFRLPDRTVHLQDVTAREWVRAGLAYVGPLVRYPWERDVAPPPVAGPVERLMVDKQLHRDTQGRATGVTEIHRRAAEAAGEPWPGPAALATLRGQCLAARQCCAEVERLLEIGEAGRALDRLRHELLPRAIQLAQTLEGLGVPPILTIETDDGPGQLLAVSVLKDLRAVFDRPFTAPIEELVAEDPKAAAAWAQRLVKRAQRELAKA